MTYYLRPKQLLSKTVVIFQLTHISDASLAHLAHLPIQRAKALILRAALLLDDDLDGSSDRDLHFSVDHGDNDRLPHP